MSVKPQVSIHIGDILSLRDWDHRFRTWGFESAVDDDSIVIFSDEKDLKKAFKENGFDYKTLEYVGKSKKVIGGPILKSSSILEQAMIPFS